MVELMSIFCCRKVYQEYLVSWIKDPGIRKGTSAMNLALPLKTMDEWTQRNHSGETEQCDLVQRNNGKLPLVERNSKRTPRGTSEKGIRKMWGCRYAFLPVAVIWVHISIKQTLFLCPLHSRVSRPVLVYRKTCFHSLHSNFLRLIFNSQPAVLQFTPII